MTRKIGKVTYTICRNNLTKLIRARKKKYYDDFFNKNNKNGAAIWKMINSTVNSNVNEPFPTNVYQLNTFFASLGESTVANLPRREYCKYMSNISSNMQTFVLMETSQAEVLFTGLSLANKISYGFYEISPTFLKSILHLILIPFTHIFNLSFRYGIVPKKLKLAKVVPIYKCGDKTQPINYRLISLLPTFFKILEKLMCTRLTCFIEKFNLLTNCQYGFRQKRNTEDAVNNLSNYVKKLIYFAYIYPYITYCLPAWGGTHVTHMNRILLLQKKAIRLIFNVDYNFHVVTLVHSNNLLLFNDIYVMKLATVMHAVNDLYLLRILLSRII